MSNVRYILVRMGRTPDRAESRYKKPYSYKAVAQKHADRMNAKRDPENVAKVPIVVMTEAEFAEAIKGKGHWGRVVVGGKRVWVEADTPPCCDPTSETYWSM